MNYDSGQIGQEERLALAGPDEARSGRGKIIAIILVVALVAAVVGWSMFGRSKPAPPPRAAEAPNVTV
ncbi:MAG: hypothetical protein EOP67_16060, partial [Sphingomonas sp.]